MPGSGRPAGIAFRCLILIVILTAASSTQGFASSWDSILSIASDPSDPDRLYACTGSQGLFISEDAGRKWTRLRTRPGRLLTIAVDPVTPSTVYISGAEGSFRSDNRGRKWTQISQHEVPPPLPIGGIAVNKRHVVMEAAWGGVRRSTDGGKTWKHAAKTPETFSVDVEFDRLDPQLAYAIALPPLSLAADFAESPVLASDDEGVTWRTIHSASVDQLLAAGRILLVTRTDGVLASDDRGETWSPLPAPPGTYAMTFDPADAAVLYAAASDEINAVYRSSDGGKSWKELFRFSGFVTTMLRTPRGLYVAAGDRLLLSNDDGAFEIIGREITAALRGE